MTYFPSVSQPAWCGRCARETPHQFYFAHVGFCEVCGARRAREIADATGGHARATTHDGELS